MTDVRALAGLLARVVNVTEAEVRRTVARVCLTVLFSRTVTLVIVGIICWTVVYVADKAAMVVAAL